MLSRIAFVLIGFFVGGSCAAALVGGAPPAPAELARSIAVIVGSRGNSCTGVVLAPDLVLTAAHCVLPGADYKIVEYDAARRPQLRDVARIERHPQFDLRALNVHRATADVALIKLAAPLPPAFQPATLSMTALAVRPGDRFLVVGAGVTLQGDGRTGGVARAAQLTATGRPGTLQLRLVDPSSGGKRAGVGACTGDSGAPVFARGGDGFAVIGLVSWSTGPNNTAGCGGLTGVTPLARYRDWIVERARAIGSPLP
jgi:secreted trypsin-like serine protease